MTIINEPLNIGASDLLRGIGKTYCGAIHVQYYTILGKKWKHRYVIISQGCIYIYTDRNSKKTEQAYSLKQFESAVECDPENGENICFCLRYKTAQAPILFSCDTSERREEWINHLCSTISEVQSTLYNVSADSGFGSADSVPRSKLKVQLERDDISGYDEVEEDRCDDMNYDLPRGPGAPNNTQKNILYENVKLKHKDTFHSDGRGRTKEKPGVNPKAFTDELKNKLAKNRASAPSKLQKTKKGPLPNTNPTCSYRSGPHSEPSFVSMHGPIEESMPHLSVRESESFYQNDTDSSNDSDNTSPKTIYENPEELEKTKIHRFERWEYYCDQKKKVKRELNQKADGVFAIFPGESTELELCVMTPKDLKYFRIYSQNERVSLYRLHDLYTFLSLDELLSHYSDNDLPGKDYSVRLQRGYNSMSKMRSVNETTK